MSLNLFLSCLPDNDGFLGSGDESKSELRMPLEGDISGLGDLLWLHGAPLPGVLVGRGLVDVTEIGFIVNICPNTNVCKYKLCDDISNNWPRGSLFTHYSLLESFDPVELMKFQSERWVTQMWGAGQGDQRGRAQLMAGVREPDQIRHCTVENCFRDYNTPCLSHS